jgi:anti-sigma factor RsiW
MQELLHAYADGELDVAHMLEVERHLPGCPPCARTVDELRELRAALRACLPRFEPPAHLRAGVSAALDRQEPRRAPNRRLLALAASVALLALGAAGLAYVWPASSPRERLVQEVIDSHVRSQLASHLLDVESSDRHRVKPWFQGKIDFAPTVRDLSDEGFLLAGGRLDYVAGRPVVALVYRRRQHVVNLLTWPAAPGEKDTAPHGATRQGYHLISWRQQGMSWWAVSDLNPAELAEFARLLRGRE